MRISVYCYMFTRETFSEKQNEQNYRVVNSGLVAQSSKLPDRWWDFNRWISQSLSKLQWFIKDVKEIACPYPDMFAATTSDLPTLRLCSLEDRRYLDLTLVFFICLHTRGQQNTFWLKIILTGLPHSRGWCRWISKASLIYITSSTTPRATWKDPISKKGKKENSPM